MELYVVGITAASYLSMTKMIFNKNSSIPFFMCVIFNEQNNSIKEICENYFFFSIRNQTDYLLAT